MTILHAWAFTVVGLPCLFGREHHPECSNTSVEELRHTSSIFESVANGLDEFGLLQTYLKRPTLTQPQELPQKVTSLLEGVPTMVAGLVRQFKNWKEFEHSFMLPLGQSWPSPFIIAIEILLVVGILFRSRLQTLLGHVSMKQSDKIERLAVSEDYPNELRLLHHRIERIAALDPGRPALIDGDKRESFGFMQACALYVARHLVEDRRVKPCSRTPIGICAEGRHMMHAILGTVQTGNPYVPLPPNLPSATRDFVMMDAKIEVVLADPSSLAEGGSWAGRREASPEHVLEMPLFTDWKPSWEVTENDLAYILYTSGSTGKPKGVLAAHYSYHNRLDWMWRTYPYKEGEVGIQKTAIGWIDHVQEVFGVLGGGAQLVLAPHEARINPTKLIDLCREHAVSRLVLVPSLLRVIVESFGNSLANELPCLRFWLISGEPFATGLLRAALEAAPPGTLVLNLYGTTEIAGDISWAAYDACSTILEAPIVPVGQAIPPNHIYLLDPDTLQPVLPGEPGEIFVEGPHLALGYTRPEEDELRFVKLPHLGIERAFRTGDFGKLDETQMIHFLGRKDQQVKVHGQRVELLQVEFELGEALSAYMKDKRLVKLPCAVMAIPSEQDFGSYRLIAFVEVKASEGERLAIDDPMKQMLRQHMLKSLLPAHLPEAFVGVSALPRLVNGKLDRVALQQLARELAGPEVAAVASEETDSFGQIRRILAEYVHGRRVVGTVNTIALGLAILFHWAHVIKMGDELETPGAYYVVSVVTTIKEVRILIAGFGALHGMGDQTKFHFSWWEPNFLLCWLLATVVATACAQNNEYLYVLPVIFLGRVWVILWQHGLNICGLNSSARTDVCSIAVIASLYLLRPLPPLHFLYQAYTRISFLPHYQYFRIEHLIFYTLGFYLLPHVVKRPAKSRSAIQALAYFGLFVVGLVTPVNGKWLLGVNLGPWVKWTLAEHSYLATWKLLTPLFDAANAVGAMGFMSCFCDGIDLTMPGPAQMMAYVCFMAIRFWVNNGVVIFGVRLFPSLRDLLWIGSKAPSPLFSMWELLVLGLYILGYFLVCIGLYTLIKREGRYIFGRSR